MNPERLKKSMLKNALELCRLKEEINDTFKLRNLSDEHERKWKLTCSYFQTRFNVLAFTGGYSGALDRIAAGDPTTIETALCFLEARPYFFRSGYMYKDILRMAKRAALPDSQASRLATIVSAYEAYRISRRRGA